MRMARLLLASLVLVICTSRAFSGPTPESDSLFTRTEFIPCVDGDPMCDADGVRNGICTLHLCAAPLGCCCCPPFIQLCYPSDRSPSNRVTIQIPRGRTRAERVLTF